MNQDYSLKMYLPVLQTILVHVIHFIYMIGMYFLCYKWLGSVTPFWHGIAYLSGLYAISLLKEIYLNNLSTILTGTVLLSSVNVVFMLLLPGIFSSLSICSFVVILAFLSVDIRNWRLRLNRRLYFLQWYFIAEPTILYLYGMYIQSTTCKVCALFMIMFWIMTHLVCKYFQGIEKYFEVNKDVEGAPRNAIFRTNSEILAMILGVMFCIMLVAIFCDYDEVFAILGSAFLKVIVWILHWIELFLIWLESLHLFPRSLTNWISAGHFFEYLTDSRIFWLWELIGNILFLTILFFMIRNGIRYFDMRLEREDAKKQEKTTVKVPKEKVENIAVKKAEPKHFLRNNRERVRYIFYKQVTKRYKDNVPSEKTSHELLDLSEKSQNLASTYDIARYSEHDISGEQLRGL